MASIFADTNTEFHRSVSSSNIPDLIPLDFRSSQTYVDDHEELPRSASYTSLSAHESASYNTDTAPVPSETVLGDTARTEKELKDVVTEGGKAKTAPVEEEQPKIERLGRRKSLVARPKSWLQRSKTSPERKTPAVLIKPTLAPPAVVTPNKAKKLSGSFASFARNTWISASRSPSPSGRAVKNDDSTLDEDDSTTASSISSSSPRKSSTIPLTLQKATEKKAPVSSLKKTPTLVKKGKRPQSDLFNVVEFPSTNDSVPNLSKSSSEKLVTPRGSSDVPPVPKTFAKEKLASMGIESGRRKDELWSAFRSLDSDYAKFHAKSSALKTNVVRATLLPFLRNYAQHPSNKQLRPEDIDRRTTILNKWWSGLLEMLDGHHSQYISGVDRPVLLEALAGIMVRHEWRLAPSYFAPLADRQPSSPLPRSRSTNSLSSSASQFLAESVYHNVRNMFIQNLLTQMNMVVDKMSLRNAPASLVTFCGKAAAYAFFFCPGVAEILAKVWNIPTETIRRVVEEFGLPRRFSGGLDELVSEFPPNLHNLGFTSTKGLSNVLLQKSNLPLGASKINWYGPWTARWCGRDSDLFFVFCKHYHILAEEFMPVGAVLVEKARAPGFVLVHAQVLTAMDATIHRQPSGDAASGPSSVTFDDVLAGADASAAALPLPPSSNIARLMAENRLIMLLRDFVFERSADYEISRLTFAEAFASVMRAAAKKTSQFDHNACFILCDFMEEALSIYIRFQNNLEGQAEYIDWPFWLDVCQKMLQSQNSMTEIRLFSLIFSAWNMIAADDRRKEILCLEWLLSEGTFQTYFQHWCPMVRAYYMRLLCWRSCRFEGEASELDTKILATMHTRLKTVWSHYLSEKQSAERDDKLPPSTAPCHPAPGRRLLIIRNDSQSPTANLFLGFDGIVQSGGNQQTAYKRHSSIIGLARSNSTDFNVNAETSPNQKKRWSLLGKIMPFNTPDGLGNNVPSSQKLEQVRLATASERSRRPSLQNHHKSSSSSLSSDSAPPTPTHRPFSFKFSLEWTPHPQVHNTAQHNNNNNNSLAPGRDRRLSPPRLPAPAHTWLFSQVPGTADEVTSVKSEKQEVKYAGRALAEWVLIVMECNNFVERRKAEGVPTLKLLEVPTLGVEGFRKFG